MALLPFGLYHLYLILRNRTTIESMEGSGRVRISSKSQSHRSNDNSNELQQPRMSIEDRLKGLTSSPSTQSRGFHRSHNKERNSAWKSDESLTKAERKLLKKANKLNIYNVGMLNNWKTIMGDNWLYWFIPVGRPKCDGVEYEINEDTLRELRRITEEVRGGVEGREGADGYKEDHELTADAQDDDRDESRTFDSRDLYSQRWNHDHRRISSTRSSNRSFNSAATATSSHHQLPIHDTSPSNVFTRSDVDHGRRPEPEFRRKGSRFNSAHGEVEWGEPPKRDFVLFGVESDDEEDQSRDRGRYSSGKGNESASQSGDEDLRVEDPWT